MPQINTNYETMGANALQRIPKQKTVIRQPQNSICFINGSSKTGGAGCMTDDTTHNSQQAAHTETQLLLIAEQSSDFVKAFKIGVLKQLHSKKLLSDGQLNQLISLQK